ncbi:YfiR family protein [Pseudomonas entomophila]|uniref:YfiR family protein n=1 Tax=Pseudomonas entomophila TaxID=312306 RepID=UPI003D2F67AC
MTGRVPSLWLAALLLFAAHAWADVPPRAPQAQQRAKAVTQVVLGIFSYARWPAAPAPLRLCVVGPTEYADDLIKGEVQNTGQPMQVRRLLAGDTQVVGSCDAVYIGKLEPGERDRLFQALNGHPVLSISEADDPCTVGSLFCLRVGDEQVTFDVNLDSVARSGVRIHPSVLQLSRRRAGQP